MGERRNGAAAEGDAGMGKVERGERKLVVRVESEADVAQLRATLKLSDGGDEVEVKVGVVELELENPFNYLALWATDFAWEKAALEAALACLVPIVQAGSSIHLSSRSQRRMLERSMRDLRAGKEGPPEGQGGAAG